MAQASTSSRAPKARPRRQDRYDPEFDRHRETDAPRKPPDESERDRDRERERERERDRPERPRSDRTGTLFDPSRHDPVRFAAQRAAASPSGVEKRRGAGSVASSATRSDLSRTSRERRRRKGTSATSAESERGNAYVAEIKRTYHDLARLEGELQEEHAQAATAHSAQDMRRTPSRPPSGPSSEVDHAPWLALLEKHKRLALFHVKFLELCLGTGALPTWRSLPSEYNMPVRLWQVGFHLMLERLRHTLPSNQSPTSGDAGAMQRALLDHLTEFIYFAYGLYANLLENEALRSMRTAWMESLGDLARYRMAVAGLELRAGNGSAGPSGNSIRNKPPRVNGPFARSAPPPDDVQQKAQEDAQEDVREHDGASIGSDALGDWMLEERDVWKGTAAEWYAKALADVPGTGRLHHHLGILARGDDLRALHHFSKAMTAAHPYPAARETALSMFDAANQLARLRRGGVTDLFVWLHGALLTRVNLDDFPAVLDRFLHLLSASPLDGGDESPTKGNLTQGALMRMLSTNIAALFQYGAADAVLTLRWEDGKEDLSVSDEELPPAFLLARRLAFQMLATVIGRVLAEPLMSAMPTAYVTGMVTLLYTAARMGGVYALFSPAVPYEALLALSKALPEGLPELTEQDRTTFIQTAGGKIGSVTPLPEDWAVRGMGWVGRRVYERGFWYYTPPPLKARNKRPWPVRLRFDTELEALDYEQAADTEEREDEEAGDPLIRLRWGRVGHLLVALTRLVPGLDSSGGKLELVPPLTTQMQRWRMEEEQSLILSKFDPDLDDIGEYQSDGSVRDEDLPEEVRALKVRVVSISTADTAS